MIKLAIFLVALAGCARAVPPPDKCICTFDYKPVCGTDGMTYPNLCRLECQMRKHPELKKKHDGPCKAKRLPNNPLCPCPKIKQPVCACSGLTYDNDCLLRCAAKTEPGLKKVHEGACHRNETNTKQKRSLPEKPSCACPKIKQLVCGSDGETYSNDCLLQCAAKTKPGLKKVHEGACQKNETNTKPKAVKRSLSKNPVCPCPKNMRPVCGSNGVTYNNQCLLECAAKTQPGLKKVHEGPCHKKRN